MRRILLDHNELSSALDQFRGREVIATGDGFFAHFDGAARAVRCAAAMTEAVRPLGIARGVAVHAAARIAALAGPGEVLVLGTTRDLLDGPGLRFADRGVHELRGLEGQRRIYVLEGP